jgi:hypothetical protein
METLLLIDENVYSPFKFGAMGALMFYKIRITSFPEVCSVSVWSDVRMERKINLPEKSYQILFIQSSN